MSKPSTITTQMSNYRVNSIEPIMLGSDVTTAKRTSDIRNRGERHCSAGPTSALLVDHAAQSR